MKLLFVIKNYYPSVGGTQIFFQHLAEYCVKYFGFDVQVYTINSYYGSDKDQFKKIVPDEECINGVKIKRFPFRRWHRKPFLTMQKMCIKLFSKSFHFLATRRTGPWSPALQKAVENTDADVIIGATAVYKYMTYPLIRHRLKSPKPFIYQGALHLDVHKQQHSLAKHILKSIQQSDVYLANSLYEKEVLIQLGVQPEKIEVLGSATEYDINKLQFDLSYHEQLKLKPTQPLIAYVGRITQFKSIDILIKAMPLVCTALPDANLLIAGFDNDYVEELKQLVATFPAEIKNNIHFKLNIDTTEKNSIYNCIDFLVLPSKSESFGLVFLEAWAFKKAVVGAKIGAIRSVIDDGINGMLFNADDVADLATCILTLLQNDAQRKQLGEAGHQKLLTNYTWDILGNKFKSICEKAINNFKLQAHTVH